MCHKGFRVCRSKELPLLWRRSYAKVHKIRYALSLDGGTLCPAHFQLLLTLNKKD
nr:MAG TPA: hypothetical protein [Caudoviricetes sp.]